MFNDVLHHAPYDNQIKVIQETNRVAKKVLICEVPNTRFADKINNIRKK